MCVSCLYIRLVPRDAQRECCTLASKYSSLNKVVVDAELADENPALLAQIALMLKRDADLNLIELQWVVQSLNKGRLLPVDDFKYTPKRKAGLTRALEDASAVEHVLVAAEELHLALIVVQHRVVVGSADHETAKAAAPAPLAAVDDRQDSEAASYTDTTAAAGAAVRSSGGKSGAGALSRRCIALVDGVCCLVYCVTSQWLELIALLTWPSSINARSVHTYCMHTPHNRPCTPRRGQCSSPGRQGSVVNVALLQCHTRALSAVAHYLRCYGLCRCCLLRQQTAARGLAAMKTRYTPSESTVHGALHS
eukprot:21035-Heterococcus_DN1.PRE.1